jgi:peptide chain release factor 2
LSFFEFQQKAKVLKTKVSQLGKVLNIELLNSQTLELEDKAQNPSIWDNPQQAQRVNVELSQAKAKISKFSELESNINDLEAITEMLTQGEDLELESEARSLLATAESSLESLEISTLLNGEYDSRGAIVTIRSGAGGDDATDFAEMLMRMYLRYCEKQSYKTSVLDISYAEGAGIKSAVFEVDAPFAYGQLSVESGTHRLVRMSPFNAAGKRQTSFAAVEVVPLIETTDVIDIPENDIRIDVFRSSGPGGQSVNTTDSAVRITHLPSGIVVSCQNEKSQLQNKAAALRVLQSRLLLLKKQEEDAKKKELAGDVKASWGEQMRSYVLAPYQMVKDLRNNFEVNNPDAVFDGEIEGFISAGLRWRANPDK